MIPAGLAPVFLETTALVLSRKEADRLASDLLPGAELVRVVREGAGWRVAAYRPFAPGLPGVVVSGAHVRDLMAVRS